MGEAATRVQRRLRDRLAAYRSEMAWHEEYSLGTSPVDVAGVGDALVLVELEWRRADPVDNTVTLFRDFVETDRTESFDAVHVVQLFSRYYDLQRGGVSTKRRNATFVGARVARTVADATFAGITLDIDPPKRDDDLPTGWREAVDTAARQVADEVGEAETPR